jgi:NADPH2:quinone reductase
MRAAFYSQVGPAREVLKLGDIPEPQAGAGEVRVRVAYSGVNPSDVKTRGGVRSKVLPFPRIIPHSDGSGVIDQLGEGVSEQRLGQRVWLWNAAWGRPDGTAAEWVVLPAAQAVALPADITLAAGACLGIPALTAYHAVTMDGGVRDRRVLVAGGAGAVGHYAIQMAKAEGAVQVVASISSAPKQQLAEAAGADATFNYRLADAIESARQLTHGEGFDRIIEVDAAANIGSDLALLHPEGDVVAYGSGAANVLMPFFPAILKNLRLRFFIVYNLNAADRTRALTGLTRLLEGGRLQHNIGCELPLEAIAEAHERIEQGRTLGNVVLKVA